MKTAILSWIVVMMAAGQPAHAEVVIETVVVGNPGNVGELSGDCLQFGIGPCRECGAVDYVYNIGKFEVSAGQYAEFLNAVAATDTYGLYNRSMDDDIYGCQITQNGNSGNSTYDFSGRPSGSEADWASRPVNYVSWGDAARFANWMHNGQPTGIQDVSTTEDGAYLLDGAATDSELSAVARKAGATWVIPSEDEWYKSAYHNAEGTAGNYYDYPTGSDVVPSNNLVEPIDPGNNATFYDGTDHTIWDPYYRTEVGAHENSHSPYGTLDQGGNVYEWNEAVFSGGHRGVRGGSFEDARWPLHARARHRPDPTYSTYESPYIGFRVAEVFDDCNANGIPDECDLDCGPTEGSCDVEGCGQSTDTDGDGVPDECDTCPGYDDAEPCPIPTVSDWGLGVTVVLLLGAGGMMMRRRVAVYA